MSHASLYPGFVKLFYTTTTLQHVAVLPCKPYQAVDDAWWVEHALSSVGEFWADAVDDYVTVLRPLIASTGGTIDFAELWYFDDPEGDPIFAATHEIALAGTGGGSAVLMGQVVLTQRTAGGGVLRTYVMEGITGVNLIFVPPAFTGATALVALTAYMQGGGGWVCGRDGTYPIASIRARSKTNDALRRKRQLFS